MSIPQYFEINHRIMTIIFFIRPKLGLLSFPFRLDLRKLLSIGLKF